jgi:hypothetical protein
MPSHEVPQSMESSEDEWSDEDSGIDGERQAADDDDRNYTTVIVGNRLRSVWRKAVNSAAIIYQVITEDSNAFADHVDGDQM